MLLFDAERIRETLASSWSLKTAPQWTESTPWAGQCNVTAAVISELFGMEILRTPWNETTDHYYNRLSGERYDFTDMQFEHPVKYVDTPTTMDEVRVTIPVSEIDELRRAFLSNWKEHENGVR